MLALRHVAQAQGGVAEVARKANLTREATYKMLSSVGNPALSSLTSVLAATGLRLSVKLMEKRHLKGAVDKSAGIKSRKAELQSV